ncbi:CHAT domain-containing protein [Kineosporia succinea]|uniref:CHAT domain-containing protein n=1 Tax=Kineosporia succinea TaxID=84632 RepID=A0ABT9P727_9ACTN|nr:CHAT domain-containing protein [Kineosporia succinea]MDP9828507.1 hypothetical protein [Kineosporia succinea]
MLSRAEAVELLDVASTATAETRLRLLVRLLGELPPTLWPDFGRRALGVAQVPPGTAHRGQFIELIARMPVLQKYTVLFELARDTTDPDDSTVMRVLLSSLTRDGFPPPVQLFRIRGAGGRAVEPWVAIDFGDRPGAAGGSGRPSGAERRWERVDDARSLRGVPRGSGSGVGGAQPGGAQSGGARGLGTPGETSGADEPGETRSPDAVRGAPTPGRGSVPGAPGRLRGGPATGRPSAEGDRSRPVPKRPAEPVYPRLDAPDREAPGVPFSVTVGLRPDQDTALVGPRTVKVPRDLEVVELQVAFQFDPHAFVLLPEVERDAPVPDEEQPGVYTLRRTPGDPWPSVRVKFVGLAWPGLRSVRRIDVSFVREGTLIGFASRAVVIAAEGQTLSVVRDVGPGAGADGLGGTTALADTDGSGGAAGSGDGAGSGDAGGSARAQGTGAAEVGLPVGEIRLPHEESGAPDTGAQMLHRSRTGLHRGTSRHQAGGRPDVSERPWLSGPAGLADDRAGLGGDGLRVPSAGHREGEAATRPYAVMPPWAPGNLARATEVTDASPDAGSPLEKMSGSIDLAPLLDHERPDLVVVVRRGADRDGTRLVYTAYSHHRDVTDQTEPRAGVVVGEGGTGTTPHELGAQARHKVATTAGQLDLYAWLQGLGNRIYRSLPEPIRRALHQAAARGTAENPATVLILSDEPHVPWELAAGPKRWGEHEESVFLGGHVAISRWLVSDVVPPSPRPSARLEVRATAVVTAHYEGLLGADTLPHAELEAARLITALEPSVVAVRPLFTDVLDLIGGRPGVDLMHFALHGRFDPLGAAGGLLLLPEETGPTPDVLHENHIRGRRLPASPFVYLNACQIGAGDNRMIGDYGGMAAAFLEAGAGAVVAPIWNIDDRTASGLAEEFYRRCLGIAFPEAPASRELLTVAEFLRRVRARYTERAVRRETPGIDATLVSFQLFGHPRLRLVHAPGNGVSSRKGQ